MKHPEILEELKPFEAEFCAAAMRFDLEEMQRIVEKAGLIWENQCRVLIKTTNKI